MIPYQPSPVLFSIGPVDIRYYSLAYLLGFILVYFWVKRRFGKQTAEDSLSWFVLATITGGRLGYFLFYSPTTLWAEPLEVLKIWRGGMSFHGALVALVLAMVLYCKRRKMQFLDLADTVIIPATIALGFGRIANFLNGELVGTMTNVSWCMQFPGYKGCRHPSQLYEAIYSFLLAGILYWQSKKKQAIGFLFTLFIALYGLFRFIVNFWRDEPRVLGISEGQILSLAMLITGVWILCTKYKKSLSKVFT